MSDAKVRAGGRARRSHAAASTDSSRPASVPSADESARLIRERDHLLRSLDDIERERAEGELDDDAHAMLRDDYTARIADLQRQIMRGSPRRTRSARVIVGAVVMVVFVVAGAVALAQALGTRTAGTELTGNSQSATLEELQAAVDAAPDDVDARIAYAQALMTEDRFEALKQFDAAAQLDPTNAQVRAYGGWMVYLLAQDLPATEQATAIAGAQTRVADAIEVDPNYPDAYFFSGLIRLRALGERAGAIADFDRYLELAPNAPMASQVRAARDEAVEG